MLKTGLLIARVEDNLVLFILCLARKIRLNLPIQVFASLCVYDLKRGDLREANTGQRSRVRSRLEAAAESSSWLVVNYHNKGGGRGRGEIESSMLLFLTSVCHKNYSSFQPSGINR